jgi:hypothetical protein
VLRKASAPRERLSNERLALVERYMIDAEEAEARRRAAVELLELEERRAAEERLHRAAATQARPATVEEPIRHTSLPVEQPDDDRRALERAERRSAKEAAKLAEAFQKKEARERKALAKAAAKRRSREQKARMRFARH